MLFAAAIAAGSLSPVLAQRLEITVDKGETLVIQQKDGTKQIVKASEIFLIGPDGVGQERKSVNLQDVVASFKSKTEGTETEPSDNRVDFFVGLGAEQVSPAMAAQLELEQGTGLIVGNVVTDSPAAKAGIKRYDVVKSVDGKPLTNRLDLVAAVQSAGKNDQVLSLAILRGGNQIAIDVKPTERPNESLPIKFTDQTEGLTYQIGPEQVIEMKQLGPGVIADQVVEQSAEEGTDSEAAEKNLIRLYEKLLVDQSMIKPHLMHLKKNLATMAKVNEDSTPEAPQKSVNKAEAIEAKLERKLESLSQQMAELQKQVRQLLDAQK